VLRFSHILVPATAVSIVLALSGCGVVVPEVAAPSPSPTYAPTGDGILRIGSILPATAIAQVAGIEVAIREINEQGGIDGAPVEVYHRSSVDPAAAFSALVEKGVDVVIGADSAEVAEQLVEPAVAAGIPVISPSATGLDGVEDSGYLFGTAVAGIAEGDELAAALLEAGATSIAYLATDDAVGADGLAALTTALEAKDADVAYDAAFSSAATDFANVATKAAKAAPDAVVVSAATAEQAAGLLTALASAGIDGDSIWLAGRSTADYSASVAPGVLEGAHGILIGAQPDEAFALRIRQADPAVTAHAFAAEAYDATIMAALAAIIGGDDGGASISRNLRSISTGGIPCASFGECLSVLETEDDIDYTGRSGPVDLSETGSPARGAVAIVSYTATNGITD